MARPRAVPRDVLSELFAQEPACTAPSSRRQLQRPTHRAEQKRQRPPRADAEAAPACQRASCPGAECLRPRHSQNKSWDTLRVPSLRLIIPATATLAGGAGPRPFLSLPPTASTPRPCVVHRLPLPPRPGQHGHPSIARVADPVAPVHASSQRRLLARLIQQRRSYDSKLRTTAANHLAQVPATTPAATPASIIASFRHIPVEDLRPLKTSPHTHPAIARRPTPRPA